MEPERGSTLSWRGEVPADPSPTSLRDGSSRYELREELGRGGMAVVHAAFDRELNRRVALKLLLPERASPGEHARLVQEAQTLAQLRHPNVVIVLDIGVLGDRVFLAMELVEGEPLRAWLATERSWQEIVRMFAAAGRGLASAHDAGIVHRDFKPDNVLVDRSGSARVADFGLARLGETNEPAGVLVGTLPYLAPELLAGQSGDARSDQFAFGVALAEALGGKRPFIATDREALRASHARGPQLDGIARAHLRAIVTRALATEPSARFATMHELVAALEHDPTARRRRLAIGGGVFAVGAITATAVALGMRGQAAGPSCADPRPLDGIWDARARAAWRTALERSKAPYARKIGATVEDGLDAYAQALHAGERAACEAVTRSAETHELSNARAACLSRARSALGQLADVLATADDAMIARAPLAVGQLPALAECADATELLRADQLPHDAVSLGRVMTVRAAIDHGMILRYLGKHREALVILDRAVPRAAEIGHKPTYAQGLLNEAQAAEQIKPPKEAEALLRSTLTVAQEGHADVTFAVAASALALNLGRLQERFDEADTWLALATSTSARLGKPPHTEANVHFAAAILANARKRFDEAVREATYALDIAERAKFDSVRRGEMVNTLGGIALYQGKFEEAGKHYARARVLAAEAYGEAHPAVISYDSNLSSVVFALGDFPRAIALRKDIVARRIAQLGPKAPRVADDRISLAFAFHANSQPEEAIAEARAGAELLLATKGNTAPGLRGQVYLAQILIENGHIDEAETIARRTLDEIAKLGPSATGDRLATLVVLADAALARGLTKEATALLATVTSHDSKELPMGLALSRQARLARNAGDNTRALELARRAQTIIVHTTGPGSGDLGMAYLEEGLAQAALRSPEAGAKLEAAAKLLKGARWKPRADEAAAALAALSPAK